MSSVTEAARSHVTMAGSFLAASAACTVLLLLLDGVWQSIASSSNAQQLVRASSCAPHLVH